ncbi:MAG TPA: DUF1116 domain-containing protein [Anaerolineales bacterium]|nr:hypothetical protein [Anaerolineae bacterium]HRK87505.1 DUF1116 domain-containing protein [Anaerolineales bacterium]
MDIETANTTAINRLMEARPILKSVAPAREVIPGMKDNLILHAGPPIEWARMSGPLRGAVIGAMMFEGLAGSEAEAASMVERGEIEFDSCHHHGTVGPMAGVTSASMKVYVVENAEHGNKSFSNLNEGYGKVLRYGAYSDEVLKKLHWMNDVLGTALADALASSNGIDMRALIAEALHMGDEGHNRNKAGSLIYLKLLSPLIAKTMKDSAAMAEVLQFIGDNALSVLNPVMAACKAMTDAAHGVDGSTIVTTMARNGTDFGIRVSGLGEKQWFTAPAEIPVGLFFSGFSQADANPDIGDSAITETAGIGGFAMATAPAIVTFVGGTPKDAMNATLEMYEITFAESKFFTMPSLDFRGTPTGIDLRKVVELGITPRINTGIAHKNAGVGQVGAGLVRPPLQIFENALITFAEKYNF